MVRPWGHGSASIALAILLAYGLEGCAFRRGDFKWEAIDLRTAALVGVIHFRIRGQDQTEHCQVCFNSLAPDRCYSLDRTGELLANVPRAETTRFMKFSCDAGPTPYVRTFERQALAVALDPRASITYFGHLQIIWDPLPGEDLLRDLTAPPPQIYSFGGVRVLVQDRWAELHGKLEEESPSGPGVAPLTERRHLAVPEAVPVETLPQVRAESQSPTEAKTPAKTRTRVQATP